MWFVSWHFKENLFSYFTNRVGKLVDKSFSPNNELVSIMLAAVDSADSASKRLAIGAREDKLFLVLHAFWKK